MEFMYTGREDQRRCCRYWALTLDGVKVGGKSVPISATGALLDSGTTLIIMSDTDAAATNDVNIHLLITPETPPIC